MLLVGWLVGWLIDEISFCIHVIIIHLHIDNENESKEQTVLSYINSYCSFYFKFRAG